MQGQSGDADSQMHLCGIIMAFRDESDVSIDFSFRFVAQDSHFL